jgi:hypothetical protein
MLGVQRNSVTVVARKLPPTGARAARKPGPFSKLFAEVANVASREVGRAWVFALALGTVVWAISGPVFGFSDIQGGVRLGFTPT